MRVGLFLTDERQHPLVVLLGHLVGVVVEIVGLGARVVVAQREHPQRADLVGRGVRREPDHLVDDAKRHQLGEVGHQLHRSERPDRLHDLVDDGGRRTGPALEPRLHERLLHLAAQPSVAGRVRVDQEVAVQTQEQPACFGRPAGELLEALVPTTRLIGLRAEGLRVDLVHGRGAKQLLDVGVAGEDPRSGRGVVDRIDRPELVEHLVGVAAQFGGFRSSRQPELDVVPELGSDGGRHVATVQRNPCPAQPSASFVAEHGTHLNRALVRG